MLSTEIVFRCCFLWIDFHSGGKSGADRRERIAHKQGIFTVAYASGLVFPTLRGNINRVCHQFNPGFEGQSAPSRIIERRANGRLPCLLAYSTPQNLGPLSTPGEALFSLQIFGPSTARKTCPSFLACVSGLAAADDIGPKMVSAIKY